VQRFAQSVAFCGLQDRFYLRKRAQIVYEQQHFFGVGFAQENSDGYDDDVANDADPGREHD
jgi:hypothetical protein